MLFRQLFDQKSSTYTYLLADEHSGEAVLIDPVFEQVNRDLALIHELGLTLRYAIDSHCHADHVTGAWLLRHYCGCQIACAAVIAAENCDRGLQHGDELHFGACRLQVRATPGHTDGCLTFVSHDGKMAFTGDALLIRGCGRCDFQQGSAAQLFDSICEQIFSLPDDYLLYPGHDYAGRCATSVVEEKRFNARLGGNASKQDFIGYMNNLVLPHPKFIDIALPANLLSGKPKQLPLQPNWAPLELTYAGVYEVPAYWVAHHLAEITVLDVREPIETAKGHIESAMLLPLGSLAKQLETVPKDKPVVTFCRSGRRSALAASMLANAGWQQVANVRGGLLRWQEQGLPLHKA